MKNISWRHEEIIAEAISNLKKGKSVAIIGMMGSGKSLLFTELMSSMPYGLYPKIICIDEVSTEDEREFVLQHLKDKQSAVVFTQHSEDEISLVKFYGDVIYKNLMIIKCAVDANGKRTASRIIA